MTDEQRLVWAGELKKHFTLLLGDAIEISDPLSPSVVQANHASYRRSEGYVYTCRTGPGRELQFLQSHFYNKRIILGACRT